MTIKTVSKELCNERTGNILEKISDVKNMLKKWMDNHAKHMQINSKNTNIKIVKIEANISDINNKILFIMNELQDVKLLKKEEEKNKKKKIDWYKWLIPIIITGLLKVLDIIFK